MSAEAPRLAGRAQEMALMRAALEAACAGTGSVVLVAGEPGIGKTRLAEEVVAEARSRGALVLWGRCYEGEGAPAFWPWIQILRAVLSAAPDEAAHAALSPYTPIIAQLVPEAVALPPDLSQPPLLEPAAARFRLFDAISGVVLALARGAGDRPLLLVLDDLHWADRASLALLSFVAQGVRDAPLLVVGTYRDVEVGRAHPLSAVISEIGRVRGTRRIALRGLDTAGVAELIDDTTGDAPSATTVAGVLEQTEGNPFFIGELIRAPDVDSGLVSGAVPPSVQAMIERRVDGLSAACREALEAAAVVGREFSLTIVSRITGHSAELLMDTLEQAEPVHLLTTSDRPGRYRFVHALVREAMVDGLSTARRTRIHRRAGEAIEAQYGRDLAPHLSELAHHYFQALPAAAAGAALYARMAGDQAFAAHAHEEAVRLYDVALQALDALHSDGDERGAPAADAERCDLLLSG